jgi:hypothetical protein
MIALVFYDSKANIIDYIIDTNSLKMPDPQGI